MLNQIVLINRSLLLEKKNRILAVVFAILFLFLIWKSVTPFLPLYEAVLWNPAMPFYKGACLVIAVLTLVSRGHVLLGLNVGAWTLLLFRIIQAGVVGDALFKLVGLSLLALSIGHGLLSRTVKAPSLLDRALFSIAAGFGILSLTIAFMNWLQLLRLHYVLPLLIGLTLISFRELVSFTRIMLAEVKAKFNECRSMDCRVQAFAISSISLSAIGGLLWALSPATHWDVLHYHLGVSEIYVQHGGWRQIYENIITEGMVRNGEMLFTLSLLIRNDLLPCLIEWLFGLLSAFALFSTVDKLLSRTTAWVASAVYFSLPLVTYVSVKAMVENIVATYVILTFSAFLSAYLTKSKSWLVIGSLMAGFALGTKLNGLLLLLPAFVCFWGIRFLELKKRGELSQLMSITQCLVLPMLLVFSPWLLFSWVTTGNPLFPYANSIFKSTLWYTTPVKDWCDWGTFGTGNGLKNFIKLPWDMAVHGDKFGDVGTATTAGVTLIGLPISIPYLKNKFRVRTLLLLIFVLIYFLEMFAVVQFVRYFLPIFAVFSIFVALNGITLWSVFSSKRLRSVLLLTGVLLASGWLFCTRITHLYASGKYPTKYILGKQTKEAFLTEHLPTYTALRFLAENLPEKEPIVFYFGGPERYYSGGAIIYGSWHFKEGRDFTFSEPTASLYRAFLKLGIQYLFIDYPSLIGGKLFDRIGGAQPEFLNKYAELVFSENQRSIYRLKKDDSSGND